MPRLGPISQAGEAQPREAEKHERGSHLSPFGVFHVPKHFIGAHLGRDKTKAAVKEWKEMEWVKKYACLLYVCIQMCMCVCRFIDSWRRNNSSP